MTKFYPFAMERMMSKWENVVDYNLSESGVHPLKLRELLDGTNGLDMILDTELDYPQSDGVLELREHIAALYDNATAQNVLVTVGCAEANFITIHTMMQPGDEMVMMLPNYMQIWGIGRNLGISLKSFHLQEDKGWAANLDELEQAVTSNTKLIAICNPNNPTGYILTDDELEAIINVADRVGAWILSDEVYRGAERLDEEETASLWGRYDKVLAMNSMSKAYGVPGLRLGWVIGPEKVIDEIWARHEYTTISASMLSNQLVSLALSQEVRSRLVSRARKYIKNGYPILADWMNDHQGMFSVVPPRAAAISFVRYHHNINSTELVNRLIHEKSVLIVPGDHFGYDHHLRVSFGLEPDYLRAGLDRIHDLMIRIQSGFS